MSAVIPFDFSTPATVTSRRRERSLNADVMMGSAGFPVLSIKGKVFAIVRDNERKPLVRTMTDEDGNSVEVPVAALQLTVVRANSKARVFYAKSYTEGDEAGKPTCFSHDGQRPDASVEEPQHANCQLCPHAQWGTKTSADGHAAKGTACTVRTRLAVTDAKDPKLTTYLLSVPAGSRAAFSDAVKLADSHGKDYNEVVMKIAFDMEAPTPKLTFKPAGLVSDETYEKISALFEDPVVKDIVGVPSVRMAQEVGAPALAAPAKPAALPAAKPPAKPAVAAQEVEDAILGAEPAKPAAKPAKPAVAAQEVEDAILGAEPAKPAPKAAAKPTKPKAETPPADTAEAASSLLGELSSILGATDD
jgi:hypothetical protein